MGECEREFLGWERPFLEHAAERWLARVAAGLDPARCVLVLPGRRAARRLEELIAERGDPAREPPRIVTEGGLAEALSREHVATASPLFRACAWRAALAAATPGEREALWSSGGSALPPAGLARLCARTFDRLAAEGLDAAQAAGLVGRLGQGEPARWRALASVEACYRKELARSQRIDPAEAARAVLERRLLRDDVHVFLLAIADLPRAQRNLIEALGARASAYVFAPESLADGFDALGALVPAAWAERDVALADDQWRVADGPDDQARMALEHLAALEPAPAPEQVSIGVLDQEVRPFLERRLLQADCAPRWAGGSPLADAPAVRLLAAALEFLDGRGYGEFAALARHPDLEAALARTLGPAAHALAPALDAYQNAHLPAVIDGVFLATAGERKENERAAALATGHGAVLALCGALADGRPRPLGEWADEIARFLARVYGAIDLGARDEVGWARAQTFQELREILDEARAVEGRALAPAEALELFAERAQSVQLAPPPADGARPVIELFGWLELALDDAPHLVLTGVDEGFLPEPGGGDPLLFEGLRRELGLAGEERRLARDVWALTAILASRRDVMLVSGRHSLSRDPRVPSRLLFRCAAAAVPARVERAFDRGAEPAQDRGASTPAPKLPRVAYRPPRSIRVTAFKDFLSAPYLFYLRHVLDLKTLDDRGVELDPLGFGILAHDVLQAFGKSAQAHATDELAIEEFLARRLERDAQQRFGAVPLPAVRLQLAQLDLRLARFARWQARRAAAGWRIREVEYDPAPILLGMPGAELELRGRIDRVDFHEASGTWQLLDYKTGEHGETPGQTHGKPGKWKDLQLPLYRHMFLPQAGEKPVEVGFVRLDRSADAELLALGKWSDADFDDALGKAREVVAKVLAGEFDGRPAQEPREAILAAICGFGLTAPEHDGGGEDEEDEA